MPLRFELFRTSAANALAQLGGGIWGWRLVDRDGRTLAHGMGYPSRETCRTAVEALRQTSPATPVVDGETRFTQCADLERACVSRA